MAKRGWLGFFFFLIIVSLIAELVHCRIWCVAITKEKERRSINTVCTAQIKLFETGHFASYRRLIKTNLPKFTLAALQRDFNSIITNASSCVLLPTTKLQWMNTQRNRVKVWKNLNAACLTFPVFLLAA